MNDPRVAEFWPLLLLGSMTFGSIFGVSLLLFREPPVPAGLCRNCGYDRRASPAKCPECGSEEAVSDGGPPELVGRWIMRAFLAIVGIAIAFEFFGHLIRSLLG